MKYSTLSIIAFMCALVCGFLTIQSIVDPDAFGYTTINREERRHHGYLEGSTGSLAIASALFWGCYLWCKYKAKGESIKIPKSIFHLSRVLIKSIWGNKLIPFYIKILIVISVLSLLIFYMISDPSKETTYRETPVPVPSYISTPQKYTTEEIKRRVKPNLPGVVEFAGYLNSIGERGDDVLRKFNKEVRAGNGEKVLKELQKLAISFGWKGNLLADKFTDKDYPHFVEKKAF